MAAVHCGSGILVIHCATNRKRKYMCAKKICSVFKSEVNLWSYQFCSKATRQTNRTRNPCNRSYQKRQTRIRLSSQNETIIPLSSSASSDPKPQEKTNEVRSESGLSREHNGTNPDCKICRQVPGLSVSTKQLVGTNYGIGQLLLCFGVDLPRRVCLIGTLGA